MAVYVNKMLSNFVALLYFASTITQKQQKWKNFVKKPLREIFLRSAEKKLQSLRARSFILRKFQITVIFLTQCWNLVKASNSIHILLKTTNIL